MRVVSVLLSLLVLSMPVVAGTVEEALAEKGRLTSDVERDKRSHPEAVIPMLALKPGAVVADIFAGGGYYSEILSRVVGPTGKVILLNNNAYQQFAAKELEQRFDGRDFPNIVQHQREVDNLDLGENALDAAMIIMSYHDLYHVGEGWPKIDAKDFLGQIYKSLKPGGRFLIVDHVAAAGTGNSAAMELHRIEPDFAKKDIESYGFQLVGSNDILRNTTDDHTLGVFDPKVRGKTDRFIMVFAKPK